jgi:hypothetical protein
VNHQGILQQKNKDRPERIGSINPYMNETSSIQSARDQFSSSSSSNTIQTPTLKFLKKAVVFQRLFTSPYN